jgi:hypothetical protein
LRALHLHSIISQAAVLPFEYFKNVSGVSSCIFPSHSINNLKHACKRKKCAINVNICFSAFAILMYRMSNLQAARGMPCVVLTAFSRASNSKSEIKIHTSHSDFLSKIKQQALRINYLVVGLV